MRLGLYECKKTFLYQRGLWYVSLFFVLYAASVILFDRPDNSEISLYLPQYQHYLELVEGRLTEESGNFLREEAKRISEAEIALDGAYESFYDGSLAEEELMAQAAPWERMLENKEGFELIYEQYSYVRENPDNRFFLNTDGWNALIAGERFDLLLFLLILLLVTPVFFQESSGKMDTVLLTQRKGGRDTALCKLCLVFLEILLLCTITSAAKYFCLDARYGLEHGNYPLQSLSYFGSSTKTLTLFQAFLLISACRAFGCLLFSALILFVSVYTQKYPLTLFVCTTVVLLPYIGLGTGEAKLYYRLPMPLGFMMATGYFKGSVEKLDVNTDQLETVFREIPLSACILLFSVTLCLGFLLCYAVIRRYTNVWGLNGRNKLRNVKYVCLLLAGILPFGLTGCSPQDGEHYDIYNVSSKGTFENGDYVFQITYDESETDITFKDKRTGETESLLKNPFKSMRRIADALYGNGSTVYYAEYEIDRSGAKPLLSRLSIIGVDTRDFSETIVFEKDLNEFGGSFFGIPMTAATDYRYFTIYAFFLDRNSIYLVTDGVILRINRMTGRTKLIPVTAKGNIAYDGRNLYFVNEKHKMVRYSTEEESEYVYDAFVTEHFYLTETEILFRNRQDKDRIYGMDPESGETYLISDRSVLDLSADEEFIYFTDKNDRTDYRMDRDGRNIVPMTERIGSEPQS